MWLADLAAEFEYGRVASEKKTIGRTIGQNHLTIATIAFCLGGTTVVTMDADVSTVPGLFFEDWAELV